MVICGVVPLTRSTNHTSPEASPRTRLRKGRCVVVLSAAFTTNLISPATVFSRKFTTAASAPAVSVNEVISRIVDVKSAVPVSTLAAIYASSLELEDWRLELEDWRERP